MEIQPRCNSRTGVILRLGEGGEGYLSDANQPGGDTTDTPPGDMPVNTDLGVARRGCSSRLTYGPFNETLMSFESPEEEDRSARRSSDRVGLEDSKGKELVNFIEVSFNLQLRGISIIRNLEIFGDSLL